MSVPKALYKLLHIVDYRFSTGGNIQPLYRFIFEIVVKFPNTYRIDYTQEWVMRLCNPRVCGYPEAKPRDKCKQVGYGA